MPPSSFPHPASHVRFVCSGTHPHRRTNAACLICSWAIIYLNQTPDEAYAPFRGVYPAFTPFHDATPITCTYHLSVYDCLCGLAKAKALKFFDFETFDPDEYEFYEQVKNCPARLLTCMHVLQRYTLHTEPPQN